MSDSPSLCEIQNIVLFGTAHRMKVLTMWQQNNTQKRQQKHKYIECILSLSSLMLGLA